MQIPNSSLPLTVAAQELCADDQIAVISTYRHLIEANELGKPGYSDIERVAGKLRLIDVRRHRQTLTIDQRKQLADIAFMNSDFDYVLEMSRRVEAHRGTIPKPRSLK